VIGIYLWNFQKVIMRALIILLLLMPLAQAATLTVGPDGSIQAAIIAAHPGDLILVQEGKYFEHLQVNKPVNLVGQGMPVLDATASGSAITLKADGTVVEGFKIINAGSWPQETISEAGIMVLSNDNRIINNDVSNNFNGILIRGVENNSILDNLVQRNLGFGIRLENANNNTLRNNSIDENKQNTFDSGINLWDRNFYSDFDAPGEGCTDRGDGICESSYALYGGRSVDEHPRCRTQRE
jgi:nitrous oxidase accessory protein